MWWDLDSYTVNCIPTNDIGPTYSNISYVLCYCGENILEFIVVLEIDAALQLWKDYFKNLFRDLRAMLE